jgi:hypothetical protein
MNKWAARRSFNSVRPIGWGMQTFGMAGDVAIDFVKSRTGFRESIFDEHKYGSINPFHKGHTQGHTWLPGLYKRNGRPRMDFAW